jgi:outer membrane protein, multidrug efflux system
VVQAEFGLRAANADIGAARAALFPRISLTGVLGFASDALGSLFSSGGFAWQAGADLGYSIFSGGSGRANLARSKAQRDAALAQYELAIQTAFREVSDALARAGTIEAQLAANRRQVEATRDTQMLVDARYRAGVDSFLANLDAQRAGYAAERTLVNTQLVRARNRIALYRSLAVEAD